MSCCDNCGVRVTGNMPCCPLCQGELSGDGGREGTVFPVFPPKKTRLALLIRLLALGTVAGAVIAVAVNLMLPQSGRWAQYAVLGALCGWACFGVAWRKRRALPKCVFYLAVMGAVLSLGWDHLTGWHGWSVDYVIPILCASAMTAASVLARVLKWDAHDYGIYICMEMLLGLLPPTLYVTGALGVIYPSLICTAVSVIAFCALLVFDGRRMWGELKRRLHL